MNRPLVFFSLAVFLFFLVAGIEVWRAAGIYDSREAREYYEARGLSLVFEGLSRVVMLWATADVVRLVAGRNTEPSWGAARAVGGVVALMVLVEILAKTLLKGFLVGRGTALPPDRLTNATESGMMAARVSVYPVYMAVIAYLVMRFRSWWAAAALTLALALSTGVLTVAVLTDLHMSALASQRLVDPPKKILDDMAEHLDVDVSKVKVDPEATDVNASADPWGNIVIMQPLLSKMTHRAAMGVLGHEVGHVRQHHGTHTLTVQGILGGVAVASAAFAMRFGTPAARMMGLPDDRVAKTVAGFVVFTAVEPIMRIVAQAVMSVQSVAHEYQADRYSASALGAGPLTAGLTVIGDIFGLGKQVPLAHSFPTHPPTRDRLRVLDTLKSVYPDKL